MKQAVSTFVAHRWLAGIMLSLLFSTGAHAQEPAKKKRTPRIPTFPIIEMETTLGTIVLELNGRRAPITVKNFVEYVRSGHYNGTIFHRVIGDFMVQGGGYDSDFAEKPTKPEIPNESGNGLRNYRGTIAMARLGPPHTASSQFFINLVDNHSLDPSEKRWGYTVFGEVIEGLDVLDKIGAVKTGSKGSFPSDVPLETVMLKSAKLRK
ncbi:MAG: peptidylprolyl isomerase [Pseudomonadota bacterium]